MPDPYAPTVQPPTVQPPTAQPPTTGAALRSAPKQDFWRDPFGEIGRFLFGKMTTEAQQAADAIRRSGLAPRRTPLDAFGPIGSAVGGLGSIAVETAYKPVQAIAHVMGRIPMGWLPGGSDESFNSLGAVMKDVGADDYAEWVATRDLANADLLHGGEMKATFTREKGIEYLDRMRDQPDLGFFNYNPGLTLAPPGSLGQGLMDAFNIFNLGSRNIASHLARQDAQPAAPRPGRFGPAPEYGGGTRLDQILARAEGAPDSLNPLEQHIVSQLQSGAWSQEHALQYLVREEQGFSRDFATQMIASILTDPSTIAAGGAGTSARLAAYGARIASIMEAAKAADATADVIALANRASQADKLAKTVYEVSQNPFMKPVAKIVSTIANPFGVLGAGSPGKGVMDITGAVATKALARTHGPAYDMVFKRATQAGLTTEVRSAIGGYAANATRGWTALQHVMSQLTRLGGEHLAAIIPDSVVGDMMKTMGRDAETRLAEYYDRVRKVFTNEVDDAQLASRIRQAFGAKADDIAASVAKMDQHEKSLWHEATYGATDKSFAEMLVTIDRGSYAGDLPLDRLVVMNENTLDNISAQAFRETVEAARGATLAERVQLWRDAGNKWTEIADLGRPAESVIGLDALGERLTELIDSGSLHTRVPLTKLQGDSELRAIAEWMARNNPNGESLWNVGFKPDDYHAWGLGRTDAEGILYLSSTPSVSHVRDTVPAYQPVHDVVTNVLGQVVGVKQAALLAKPVEAVEVAMRVATDAVSGARLLMNIEQRFVVNMAALDVAPAVARRLFEAAKRAASLQETTLQGVMPINLWREAEQIVIDSGLQGTLTRSTLLHELLDASGGDMRIMGLTSGFSQRARTQMEGLFGAEVKNYTGAVSVNAYRLMRYTLNPVFYIQRITDAVYFSLLKGVPLSGGGVVEEGSRLWEVEQISRRIGETNLARDMSFDMRHYQLGSEISGRLAQRVNDLLPAGPLEELSKFGGRLQTNNMWQQTYNEFGNLVKETLEEVRAEKAQALLDPTLSAAERELGEQALKDLDLFPTLRAHYSAEAGRLLDDNEVGLRFLQEQYAAAGGRTVTEEGIAQWRHNIVEGTYQDAGTIGELKALRLDLVAEDLGYASVAAMKEAALSGETSVQALAETLANHYNASPAYIKRFVDAFNFNWNDFWSSTRVSLGLEGVAERAALEGIIAREATLRGMTPVEYLSQALPLSSGRVGAHDHVGQLLQIIRGGLTGTPEQQSQRLASIWIRSLDPSAQRLLVGDYVADIGRQITAQRALGTMEGELRAQELVATRARFEAHVANPAGEAMRAAGVPQSLINLQGTRLDEKLVLRFGARNRLPPAVVFLPVEQFIGDGLRNAPVEQADLIARHLGAYEKQFPGIRLVHLDSPANFHLPVEEGGLGAGLDVDAWAISHDGSSAALHFSPRSFGPDAAAYWDQLAAKERFLGEMDAALGIEHLPGSIAPGPAGVVAHEVGHALHWTIVPPTASPETLLAAEPYLKLLRDLELAGIPQRLSQYAAAWAGDLLKADEWYAELFAAAFSPNVNRAALPADLQDAIQRYRQVLEDLGYYVPVEAELAHLSPGAVDAVAGGFAEGVQRSVATGGLDVGAAIPLDEAFATQVARRAAGRRNPHPNPDVEGVTRAYAAWLRDLAERRFLQDATTTGGGSRELVGKLTSEIMERVPTDGAFVYNQSEALVQQVMANKMKMLQREAFMLAEMSTQRTMAGRTINHPVFGLYPTSYMWGKVFPQTVKFLAKESFGFKSPIAGVVMHQVQQSIAMRREWDPKFDRLMGTLGRSETAFLLDYLTPGLPWSDFRAAAPQWFQKLVESKTGIPWSRMAESQFNLMDTSRWFGALFGTGAEIAEAIDSGPSVGGIGSGGLEPPTQTAPGSVPQAPTGPAATLGPGLVDALADLTGLFSGQ